MHYSFFKNGALISLSLIEMATAGKSRFWGGESDGSESDGSESSSNSSGSGDAAAKPAAVTRGAGRFQVESDSESEEENRVAKSVKDRTWEGLQVIIKAVNNHLKINSWVSLQEGMHDLLTLWDALVQHQQPLSFLLAEVDKLIRAQERAITVIAKEGLPRFFVRALVELEDAVSGVSKADTKSMSQSNAKAYTRVKQTMKKYTEKFTAQITAYRAAPDRPDEVPEGGGKSKSAAAKRAAADDESSEDEVVIGRKKRVVRVFGVT